MEKRHAGVEVKLENLDAPLQTPKEEKTEGNKQGDNNFWILFFLIVHSLTKIIFSLV